VYCESQQSCSSCAASLKSNATHAYTLCGESITNATHIYMLCAKSVTWVCSYLLISTHHRIQQPQQQQQQRTEQQQHTESFLVEPQLELVSETLATG
jgi:hypothetical protein